MIIFDLNSYTYALKIFECFVAGKYYPISQFIQLITIC